MALNYSGKGNTSTLGLGGALPSFNPGSYTYTPVPPSFDPGTGTTRFQSMYSSSIGNDLQPGESYYYHGAYRKPDSWDHVGDTPPDGYVLDGASKYISIPVEYGQSPTEYGSTGTLNGMLGRSSVGEWIAGPAELRKGVLGAEDYSVVDLDSFLTPSWERRNPSYGMNAGGMVRNYNEGGLAMAMPQEEMMGAPMPNPDIQPSSQDSEELINMALVAIDPNSDMPDDDRSAVLALFEEVFGPGSVEMLKEEYMGKDEVPAMLTPGEVVVPKNKVLHAGGGDPDAGARSIMQVVDELGQLRGGEPAAALGGAGGIASALGMNDGGLVPEGYFDTSIRPPDSPFWGSRDGSRHAPPPGLLLYGKPGFEHEIAYSNTDSYEDLADIYGYISQQTGKDLREIDKYSPPEKSFLEYLSRMINGDEKVDALQAMRKEKSKKLAGDDKRWMDAIEKSIKARRKEDEIFYDTVEKYDPSLARKRKK